MEKQEMIGVVEFCSHHKIEQDLLDALSRSGLVQIIYIDDCSYIPYAELQQVEKLVRLYEMEINIEGIEAISHLLTRVKALQDEVRELRNQLHFYE